MIRLRLFLAAAAMAAAILPARIAPVLAANPTPSPQDQIASLDAQLTSEQATLTDLNDQVERAQADVDQLGRKLIDDQQRETRVGNELAMMGKLEYEQPSISLSTILEATSLQQLLSTVAQARLIAAKQRNVLDQAHALRRQDQQAHDQVAARLGQVQSARDAAAKVAAQTQALLTSVQDAALRARANAVVAQAKAAQPAQPVQVSTSPGSGPYPNHFSFGYCTYYVATRRYVPWFGNAIQWWPNAPGYGYSEGSTPKVGSIMVTRESSLGHVAYVESVNGNSFTVSEMNYAGWNVVDRRTIQLGGSVPIVGFIY